MEETPAPGEVIAGKYRIERLIGRGGMGVVYSAEHLLLGQRVAVKVRRHRETDEEGRSVARFFNEARAAARIDSPHVARVFDVDRLESGQPYIVMELLQGRDLAAVLAGEGRQPEERVIGWMLQAIEGLAEAHALGIVHRDLKPANLFLAMTKRGELVKVLDFGVSKLRHGVLDTPTNLALTTGDSVIGTPAYMAPEQIRTPKDVDARADVWAIGVLLYELVSAARPFEGATLGEFLSNVLANNRIRLSNRQPQVDPRFEKIVDRCLRLKPEERFPDVVALAEALAELRPDRISSVDRARTVLESGPDALRPSVAPLADASERQASTRTLRDAAESRAGQTKSSWVDFRAATWSSPARVKAASVSAALVALVALVVLSAKGRAPRSPAGTSSVAEVEVRSGSTAPSATEAPAPRATATIASPTRQVERELAPAAPVNRPPIAQPRARAPSAARVLDAGEVGEPLDLMNRH